MTTIDAGNEFAYVIFSLNISSTQVEMCERIVLHAFRAPAADKSPSNHPNQAKGAVEGRL